MASGNGDDDYNSALQRLMKECLPPILVEIADKRPSDPILYMAHSLHKYREKEDIRLFHLEHSGSQQVDGNSLNTMQLDSNCLSKSRDKTVGHQVAVKGMIVERDLIDVSEHFEAFNISNKIVHQHCSYILKQIGDIFDEDDIS
ncbi:uncharacterized protein LOC123529347 isoform X2 [Mercenaria mercenaria]|uniref:uncharacterized protein LOC123529347 isoform X2 n=1 Tax=Mercenaria mercenaria TaxID=6596 RepID=UPI001E1DB8F4|nr:uncharacterized protein LOC123529347 isoform X2 [Mercenaria mercenaria]